MASKIILASKYSNRLFLSSTTIIFSVYSAWYNELYYCLLRSLLVMLTSLFYWKNPVDGFRRKLDILCANGCICYQLIFTANELPILARTSYTAIAMACLWFYLTARNFGRRKIPDYDMSSRWHMCIHIFGNIGNLILYDGIGKRYINWNIYS